MQKIKEDLDRTLVRKIELIHFIQTDIETSLKMKCLSMWYGPNDNIVWPFCFLQIVVPFLCLNTKSLFTHPPCILDGLITVFLEILSNPLRFSLPELTGVCMLLKFKNSHLI